MTKRAAMYARVSTTGQTAENQLGALREVAQRMGWEVVAEYVDQGVSGARGRDKRPEFDALCTGAVRRDYDVVMAWSVDRLGRSLQDLVAFLGDLNAKGVDLYLHQQGVDTTTPGGKALFQMMGVFAEFEREMIRDRVKAGLERAKASGKTLGRPRTNAKTAEKVLALRRAGRSVREIAKATRLSVGTVHQLTRSPV